MEISHRNCKNNFHATFMTLKNRNKNDIGQVSVLFVKKIYFPNIFPPKNDDKQMQNEKYVFLEFYHRVWLQAIQAKTSGQDLDLEDFFSTTADQL